jgi:hypothetical protein
MEKVFATVLAAVLLAASVAAAQQAPPLPQPSSPAQSQTPASDMKKEVVGTIKSVDGDKIVLDDGTELILPATLKMNRDDVKQGVKVKVSYQEQGGQKVVTSIQRQSS